MNPCRTRYPLGGVKSELAQELVHWWYKYFYYREYTRRMNAEGIKVVNPQWPE